MALSSFLPAILGGAAALFGGDGDSEFETIPGTPANIPGGPALELIGQHRTNSTLPYTSSPFRTIDFGQGLPSYGQQTPQFVPNQGQSVFDPNYGGGYSGGTQSNYGGGGLFGGGAGVGGVQPIYGQSYNPVQGFLDNFMSGQTANGLPQQQPGLLGGQLPQQATGDVQGQQQQQAFSGQRITPASSTTNPGAGADALRPGDPYHLTAANTDVFANGLTAPTAAPSEEFQQSFTPNIFRDPFVSGINAASQSGSFAAQALPGAGAFQAGLYDPGLNAHEQSFLTAGANLGLRGLESAFNQIDSQYENTPFAASRGKQRDDAANVFANNMLQQSSQLGLQRQQLATQNLPGAFNQPLQSNQFGQQSAAGLYNMFDTAMRGDLQDGQFIYNNFRVPQDTIVQR